MSFNSHSTSQINQHEIIPAKNDIGALANRINMETRTLHNQIDKMVTLKFALAVRDPKIYRQGIQMFYHIFSAIEDCIERELNNNNKYTEMFKNIYKPEMLRRSKLHKDLMFFYDGHEEKFEKPILTKQIEFSDYIRKTTSDHPYLLLAYMHVLYLALFAGGRIMSSQVAKSLRLFPQVEGKSYDEIVSEGTNFYKFDVEDMEVLRIIYKRDYELQTRNFLTEEEKEEIINESKFIFKETAEGIKEIENHNLQRMKGTIAYHVFTKGYYALISILLILICYITKKIIFSLL
ncbi:heme oxygenase [Pichia californica]|uniref:Heme oxygenase n=1 Tax=Pichia californica TaxID=460514 RepID=A0A9P7BI91_9ASCO|nr:heme oxygenase [[Candida] californica]KAG0691219.1 heme oxygenase [[Candida] californica]